MECGTCGSPLDRPGDYCLVCRSTNAGAVVVEFARDRATVTPIVVGDGSDGRSAGDDGRSAGQGADDGDDGGSTGGDRALRSTTVTTVPESGESESVELRNFVGRVADEVRRKRPETVYIAGDREVVRAFRAQVHHELYRVDREDPVAAALDGATDPLETVDAPPGEKIGGSHSTLIAGREGRRAIQAVAGHPHVKKVIPGPIDAGGTGSRSGTTAKATRPGANGNVRLLLRDGSSVQENRVVTTARDRETGERVRADLNEALAEADLQ